MILDYIILWASDPGTLEESVSVHIEKGYIPSGPLVVVPNIGGHIGRVTLYQPMILREFVK